MYPWSTVPSAGLAYSWWESGSLASLRPLSDPQLTHRQYVILLLEIIPTINLSIPLQLDQLRCSTNKKNHLQASWTQASRYLLKTTSKSSVDAPVRGRGGWAATLGSSMGLMRIKWGDWAVGPGRLPFTSRIRLRRSGCASGGASPSAPLHQSASFFSNTAPGGLSSVFWSDYDVKAYWWFKRYFDSVDNPDDGISVRAL